MLYGVLFLANLVMAVYCVLDVIRRPAEEIRNLPKAAWLVLCLLFPIVGGIAWLTVGRPPRAANPPHRGNKGVPAEYDRPGRAVATNPDDDEAFLRRLRERAEEQRRQAEKHRDDENGGGAGLTT